MADFTPDDKTIKIMSNFSDINQSMYIQPDKLEVISTSRSVLGKYIFPKPFDFEPFGIIESSEFLTLIGHLSKPQIEVHDKFVYIKGANDDKVKYSIYAKEKVPVVPSIQKKLDATEWKLEFALPADKMTTINKIANVLKAKYIFFETLNKSIVLTIGESLQSSDNNYEVVISDNIMTNNLSSVVQIPLIDFKVMAGEYNVKISEGITQWENLNGVLYHIAPRK
jgi:hypothetical protein